MRANNHSASIFENKVHMIKRACPCMTLHHTYPLTYTCMTQLHILVCACVCVYVCVCVRVQLATTLPYFSLENTMTPPIHHVQEDCTRMHTNTVTEDHKTRIHRCTPTYHTPTPTPTSTYPPTHIQTHPPTYFPTITTTTYPHPHPHSHTHTHTHAEVHLGWSEDAEHLGGDILDLPKPPVVLLV